MAEITYTIKTKVFSETRIEDLEKSMNDWLKEKKVKVLDIHISVHPMFDMYQGREPTVCNQWGQHISIIIYNEIEAKS
ncbi:MAG: hypothetical protein ACK5M3_15550 [Dysgonomonas sp.]